LKTDADTGSVCISDFVLNDADTATSSMLMIVSLNEQATAADAKMLRNTITFIFQRQKYFSYQQLIRTKPTIIGIF